MYLMAFSRYRHDFTPPRLFAEPVRPRSGYRVLRQRVGGGELFATEQADARVELLKRAALKREAVHLDMVVGIPFARDGARQRLVVGGERPIRGFSDPPMHPVPH